MKRVNRGKRRKTAMLEAIAAVRKFANEAGYQDGFRHGHADGAATMSAEIANEFLHAFDGIAQGSVELKQTRSTRVQIGILIRLLQDWVRPFSLAQTHANNASERRGAVLAPHRGFPLPLTVEVAVHNTDPTKQVVTAMLHRTGDPNAAVAILDLMVAPRLEGFGGFGNALARRDGMARVGEEIDAAAEILKTCLMTMMQQLVDEYVRVNAAQFNRLLRRKRT